MLEVHHADATRVLYLLGGDPVGFRSTAPEDDLADLLTARGGLDAETARARTAAEPSITILDRLQAEGALEDEAARSIWQAWLGRGVVAPLDRVDGTWVFRHHPDLQTRRVDRALMPGVCTLGALRAALDAVVPLRVALAEAEDRDSPLGPGARHGVLAGSLDLPAALTAAIETGGDLAPLVADAAPDAFETARLVWMLVRLGVVEPDPGIPAVDLLDTLRAAGPGDTPRGSDSRQGVPASPAAPRAPDARPPRAELLEAARGGADPVRFLGLSGEPGDAGMAGTVERLGQRWSAAAADPDADAAQRAAAELLLGQVRRARAHLAGAEAPASVDPDKAAP